MLSVLLFMTSYQDWQLCTRIRGTFSKLHISTTFKFIRWFSWAAVLIIHSHFILERGRRFGSPLASRALHFEFLPLTAWAGFTLSWRVWRFFQHDLMSIRIWLMDLHVRASLIFHVATVTTLPNLCTSQYCSCSSPLIDLSNFNIPRHSVLWRQSYFSTSIFCIFEIPAARCTFVWRFMAKVFCSGCCRCHATLNRRIGAHCIAHCHAEKKRRKFGWTKFGTQGRVVLKSRNQTPLILCFIRDTHECSCKWKSWYC